jgi:hypothetical protein
MHFLFIAGACPLITMVMLKEASNLKLMTYAAIQDRTENFSYGALDALDRPHPVQVNHLQNNRINGTAAQKYSLFRLFPIIFADITARLKTFNIYLILREILDMVLASPVRKSWLPYIEILGINFHNMMVELLPDKVIPKIHFVTEYSKIIEENGPAIKYWCMRYEGAHAYFKKIALQSYNFKNIPKTLAQRQQLRHCFLLSESQFLKTFDEASGIRKIEMYHISSTIKDFLTQQFGKQFIQSDQLTHQCSQLIHNHITYKQFAIYVYDLEYVEEIPLFLQILYIFKSHQQWLFVVVLLYTDGFNTNLWSYKVRSSNRLKIVTPNDLKYYHKGLDLYKIDGFCVVNLTSRLTKEN